MQRKLGCRPAERRVGQPRLSSLRMMARSAPVRLLRNHINPAPLMLGNDKVGNCTSVGLAKHIRATAAVAGFQVDIVPENAISFYSRSTGYVPSRPETDQGGVEVDVLACASRIGYDVPHQRFYPLWGSSEPEDLNVLRLIVAGFGAAYVGVQLAQADQMSGIWDTITPGNQQPGSWGGHCLLVWEYTGTADDDLVTVLTWGIRQKCTWRWLRSRLMEVHGVIWPQLVLPGGLYPTGDDLEKLRAENAAFLGN